MLSPEVVNYNSIGGGTTEVAKYPANAWGLYDMHGNVWEWCADHQSKIFETALKDSNPIVSSNEKTNRVLRGGSQMCDSRYCTSSYRNYGSPAVGSFYIDNNVGFRVACSLPRT